MEADDDVFHDAEDELSDHEQHEATTSGGGTHFGTPLPEPACEAGDGDGDAVAGGATAEDHLPLHRCVRRLRNARSSRPRLELALTLRASCSAAFNGDLSALDAALTALPPARWTELDDCGNTARATALVNPRFLPLTPALLSQALHVAVLRRKAGCVALLLQRGFPPKQKSSAGWAAIYEAIAAGNEPLVLALHTAAVRADEAAYKRRKPELLAALAALPDFRCALRWEFCSPIFAPLLRVFAPHDTYTLTKRGTSLRIDGSLKGLVDDESSGDGGGGSLMPQWDRGAFSLLFSASAAAPTPAEDGSVALAPPQLLLSDHDTRETVDALPPGAARSDAELAEEAAALLAAGAAKSKMRAREFSFAPQRTWRGAVKREKAEGWQTTVYEAKGRVEAQQRLRSGRFALRGSFEQYLASAADGAADELVTLDLAEEMENEEGSAGGGGGDSGSAGGSDAGAGELGADSGASGGAATQAPCAAVTCSCMRDVSERSLLARRSVHAAGNAAAERRHAAAVARRRRRQGQGCEGRQAVQAARLHRQMLDGALRHSLFFALCFTSALTRLLAIRRRATR
jgi:hypothetical protein